MRRTNDSIVGALQFYMDHSLYLGPQYPGIPTCSSSYGFAKIWTQRNVYI